jgi:hypothetical protein
MPPPSALSMSTLQKTVKINKRNKKGREAGLDSGRLQFSVGVSLE